MNIKLGIYQHYKGHLYQVIGIARDSNQPDQILVVYQALYGSYGLWVRTYQDFTSSLNHDGIIIPRFKFLHEATTTPPTLD